MPKNIIFVYKISFKKYLSAYSNISDTDLDKIASLEIDSSFDYEKDEMYYCYVITSKIEIDKYKKILEKNFINYTCENISNLLLQNEYDITYIKDYIDNDNFYLYDVFMEDLNKWLYENLDIDTILDIISFKGINSLRPVDKKFLKDNHEK